MYIHFLIDIFTAKQFTRQKSIKKWLFCCKTGNKCLFSIW